MTVKRAVVENFIVVFFNKRFCELRLATKATLTRGKAKLCETSAHWSQIDPGYILLLVIEDRNRTALVTHP